MSQREVRDLLTRWYLLMDQRTRRAFRRPEVVQKDFQAVWVRLSADGFSIGIGQGIRDQNIHLLLDPTHASIAEDLRRFVLETIREREDLAVKRELQRGEFAGFAAALKRDLAEDAIVGDL